MAPMPTDRTASFMDDSLGGSGEGVPCLVLGVQCACPSEASRLFDLRGIDEVNLGRARDQRLVAERQGQSLRIAFPDRWLSTGHASLSRKRRHWTAFDRSSKNGTFVNGERIEAATLGDGDLLEVGSTFLMFKSAVPVSLVDDCAGEAGARTFSWDYYRVLEELQRLAPSQVPVLVCGETGSGKEVVSRRLHELSERTGPFLGINCAAIAGSLAESELFGHKRGSFSGALEDHAGLFRSAQGGTLMLDEISELDRRLQAKLLRVLQEREVLPVGETRPQAIDVRIVSATSRDLRQWVQKGHFREDLFARLAGHEIDLPALRDRMEDLGLLVGTLLERILGDGARRVTLKREAVRALYSYRWPNNVRELEQALAAAAALAADSPIGEEHLPKELSESARRASRAGGDVLSREALVEVLSKHRGNVSAVGRELGKARVQVRRWCKRFGIDPESFRAEQPERSKG